MGIWFKLWVLFGLHAQACELPALNLQFEGTAFAKQSFQVEGSKIYFFKNTPRALSLAYLPKKKQWCYQKARASAALPVRGCLGRELRGGKKVLTVNGNALKNFVLRDPRGKPVATISVLKNQLTAYFVNPQGKTTGKRVVFRSVSAQGAGLLHVSAWNCPNPRFLSCAGSEVQTVGDLESANPVLKLKSLELSKNLGHYQMSCAGVHESNRPLEQTPREPAFAPMEAAK